MNESQQISLLGFTARFNELKTEWEKVVVNKPEENKNSPDTTHESFIDALEELSSSVQNLSDEIISTYGVYTKNNNNNKSPSDISEQPRFDLNKRVQELDTEITDKIYEDTFKSAVTSPAPLSQTGGKLRKRSRKRKTLKKAKRKWSNQYKKSINCKKPNGFSQNNIVSMEEKLKLKKPEKIKQEDKEEERYKVNLQVHKWCKTLYFFHTFPMLYHIPYRVRCVAYNN